MPIRAEAIMSGTMGGTTGLWDAADAEATLPAQDVERAKAFYAERLGMSPTYEDKVGVHFVVGSTRFRLFKSGGSASGSHTQLALIVGDVAAQVNALRARGLQFEEYDYPNLKTVEGVADLGYARAAWFKDSEGNLLGIAELT
jgi:catechol-2,3-dioxygenase